MAYITENTVQVLVFKTNVETDAQKQQLLVSLSAELNIGEISLDMEDIDKVLRIVTGQVDQKEIITRVNAQGFFCGELD